jgi:hypothetical protein
VNFDVYLRDFYYTVEDNITPEWKIVVEGDNSPYSAEGNYSVSIRAKDEAGNCSDYQTINFVIDKTPPVITSDPPKTIPQYKQIYSPFLGYTTNFVPSGVQFPITAIDPVSGGVNSPVTIYYRIQSAGTWGSWQIYTTPLIFTAEGPYTIEYFAKDAASNYTVTKSFSLYVDATPPDVKLPFYKKTDTLYYVLKDVSYGLEVKDILSGVKNVIVKIDNQEVEPNNFNFTSDKEYSFYYLAEDNVGNKIEKTITVKIDTSCPVVDSITPYGVLIDGQYYIPETMRIKFTFQAHNGETEVVRYSYCVGTDIGKDDVVKWSAAEPIIAPSAVVKVSKEIMGLNLEEYKTYYIGVKVRDAPGNWSDILWQSVVVHRGAFATQICAAAEESVTRSGQTEANFGIIHISSKDYTGYWANIEYGIEYDYVPTPTIIFDGGTNVKIFNKTLTGCLAIYETPIYFPEVTHYFSWSVTGKKTLTVLQEVRDKIMESEIKYVDIDLIFPLDSGGILGELVDICPPIGEETWITEYVKMKVESCNKISGTTFRARVRLERPDTTPPTKPRLLFPVDNLVTNNKQITIMYSSSTDTGSGISHYVLQVDNNNDFSSPEINVKISTTLYTIVLADGRYYWRVIAYDKAGNSNVSDVRSFVIDTEDTISFSAGIYVQRYNGEWVEGYIDDISWVDKWSPNVKVMVRDFSGSGLDPKSAGYKWRRVYSIVST